MGSSSESGSPVADSQRIPSLSSPLYTCERCAATSRNRSGFLRVGLLWQRSWRCRPCTEVVARATYPREIANQILLALGSLALTQFLPADSVWGRLLHAGAFLVLNILCLPFVLLLPMVVIHELAHWGVGRLVGLRILAVQIGLGRTLARFRLGGVPVSFHEVPSMGLVWPAAPSLRWARSRWALMTSAGPATHIAWLAAAIYLADAWALGAPWQVHTGVRPLASLALLNGIMLLLSLAPVSIGGQATDGATLLSLPFMKSRDRLGLVSAQWWVPAQRAFADGDLATAAQCLETGLAARPGDVLLRMLRADVWAERGEFDRALEALRDLRRDPEVEDRLAPVLANDLAWTLALRGRSEDLAEADALSGEAQSALGELPPVLSTRGQVLLSLGKPEEAGSLLRSALSKTPEGRFRAAILYNLARAEHALGRPESAGQRLDDARSITLDSPSRARAEAELALPAPPLREPLEGSSEGASPQGESTRRWKTRRLAFAVVPAAAFLWTCGPGLVSFGLTAGVPGYDPTQGPASLEVQAECWSGLARLDAANTVLQQTGVLEDWSWVLSQRRAALAECVGARAVAQAVIEQEIARLEAGLPEGPLDPHDDAQWTRAALLLQAWQNLAAVASRDHAPEDELHALTEARKHAKRFDGGAEAWNSGYYTAEVDAALGRYLERQRGDIAALDYYEAAIARLEQAEAEPYVLAKLLHPYARLLETRGREEEATRVWARIGRGASPL